VTDRSGAAAERPVVASYCATFLKPEMLHIYRQISALERFRPFVIAQKREEPERFPFAPIEVVGKPATHFLRRFWFKQIRKAPWQISPGELSKLLAILDRRNAQLLHIYFGHIAVHLLPLILKWPRSAVVSFHGADVMVDMDKPAHREATARMLNAVRLVLVRSRSLRDAVIRIGCPENKIRIQRTGIPVAETPFVARTWPSDGQWRLVQAGRLIEKKGFATSLRAFAEFAARYPKATFAIAGDGPLQRNLEAQARELGIGEKVFFRGFLPQNELRELFYSSQIFLHPSETGADGNQEGVPNSMLEAMASGLPVFATAHGGIPEAIENDRSGILVAEKDHTALAAKLLEFAATPQRLTEIALAGAQSVAEKFDQPAQVRQLEDYYFEALASPASSTKGGGARRGSLK
jgi:glycosyltransferase involved in cell wall biosynthesis